RRPGGAEPSRRRAARGGLGRPESLVVARLLAPDGGLDALELTAGSSLQTPMYLFRGEAPVAEMAGAMPKAIRPAFRRFGGLFLKEYPYEEAYLPPHPPQFLAALHLPLVPPRRAAPCDPV